MISGMIAHIALSDDEYLKLANSTRFEDICPFNYDIGLVRELEMDRKANVLTAFSLREAV